ncbi:SseB family protein [Verrucosispora sp. NA02020]|uniref:SseB family protein n=1 Tax=Verrucosispora sp. NA02020 TaxID=2742132 RepID=UPI0020CA8858|nr:SseB family protein [Verrucosispora sp. NA02020]
MTDWAPATEAEAAMRDALRGNDQQLYFRILSRVELLLPISAQPVPGQVPAGWGTWTTGGRTHVLAFTSAEAMRSCLGDHAGPSRRSGYAELAAGWPNHEWWLAVNPGLPIEGYLPAWFVSQLSRGDVRLPGRTVGARARLERVEALNRSREGRASHGTPPPATGTARSPGVGPDRPAPSSPQPVAPAAFQLPESPVAAPGTVAGPHQQQPGGGSPGRPDLGRGAPVQDSVPRQETLGSRLSAVGGGRVEGPVGAPPSRPMPTPGEEPTVAGPGWPGTPERAGPAGNGPPSSGPPTNGRPADTGSGQTPRRSFFEPSNSRTGQRADRLTDRATPPSRLAARGGQPFPRRGTAADPSAEGKTRAFDFTGTESGARPESGGEPTQQLPSPGGATQEPTRPLRVSPPNGWTAPGGLADSGDPTEALPPRGPAEPTEELSAAEPVSGPPATRRGFTPIVIEGTIIEARDLSSVDDAPSRPQGFATFAGAEPTVRVPPVEADPTMRVPVSEAEPTVRVPVSEAEPTVQVPSVQAEPTAQVPLVEAEPTTWVPTVGAEPTAPVRTVEPETTAWVPTVEPETTAWVPTVEAEPTVQVPSDEPTARVPSTAPETTAWVPTVEPETTAWVPTVGAEPTVEVPSAEAEPTVRVPVPQAAPTASVPLVEADPTTWVPTVADPTGWIPTIGSEPTADVPSVEAEPTAEVPLTDAEPTVEVPSAGSEPTADLVPAGSEPTAEVPPVEATADVPLVGSEQQTVPLRGTIPESAIETELITPPASPTVARAEVSESGDGSEPTVQSPAATTPDAASVATPPAAGAEFTPANDVEVNLLEAAEAGSTDTFLSTLLLARVLMPVAADSVTGTRPGDPGFVWPTVQLDGQTFVVAYTSPQRLSDHTDPAAAETLQVRFVQLIRCWPDTSWSFAVNPGTPVGAKLPGEQIVGLANWAAELGLGDDPERETESSAEPTVSSKGPREAAPVVDPVRPIVMQKAIAPSQLGYYLERGYDRVSGFVHRAGELAHLDTPAKLHGALGLDHPESPFAADAEQIYVLRWPAYRPSLYRIPYGGQNEAAMRAMEGWVIERPPFRGNGFAPGESSDVVAEFKVDSVRLPHGAQLLRIGADGTERLVAVLDTDTLAWRQVGER